MSVVLGILGAAALFGASAWLVLGHDRAGACGSCAVADACAAGARQCESNPTSETDHDRA